MRRLSAILLGLALSGCGYIQAAQNAEQARQADAAMAEATTACERTLEDARLDALRSKLAFNLDRASLSQLADTTTPTDDERRALSLYEELRMTCAARFEDALKAHYPAALTAFYDLVIRGRYLLVALYQDQITYGAYHRLAQESVSIYRKEVEEIDRGLRREQLAYAQIQAQRDQAFLEAGLRMLQPPRRRPPPTTTNCRWLSNTLHCTTW